MTARILVAFGIVAVLLMANAGNDTIRRQQDQSVEPQSTTAPVGAPPAALPVALPDCQPGYVGACNPVARVQCTQTGSTYSGGIVVEFKGYVCPDGYTFVGQP